MHGTWSNWKSWWLDIAKFAITFTLGVLVTVTLLERRDDRRARLNAQWSAVYAHDMDCLNEFRVATARYHGAAMQALRDRVRFKGSEDSEAIRRWRGEALDELALGCDAVSTAFGEDVRGVESMLDSLYALNATLTRTHDAFRLDPDREKLQYSFMQQMDHFAAVRDSVLVVLEDYMRSDDLVELLRAGR